jgi:outer membrane protein assembly factor BamE
MRLSATLLFISITVVSGCSWFKFPGIHKVQVQQGNLVTQEMVDELQLGMTKSQVQFVLGTPLVMDTFEQARWDYVYSRVNSNGKKTQQQITVFFDNTGKLIDVEGDYLPKFAESQN